MSENNLHIFGIRHHGPGSAKSLLRSLDECKPDIILIEGPADAQDKIELAGSSEMKPPVTLLVYSPDDPQKSAFYPFTVFSPEWQAIQYALENEIAVRFMDLPQSHILAGKEEETEGIEVENEQREIRHDPISHLATAAGYADSERWWENMVEARQQNDSEIFQAVLEGMSALRDCLEDPDRNNLIEQRREAYMRKTLRAAQKEGFENIAIVCGAWHGPAFLNMPSVKSDNELLKGLPKVKTQSAWAPWSYSRISYWTGYGAGVHSPEWYHMLWEGKNNLVTSWMTRAARLMREHQLDVSSAHAIEAVRLAETLAALRGHPHPGLEEMDEAALTVMCFGEEAPMRLVRKQMIVGSRMGQIPQDAPVVPIQQDLAKLQKKLRLPAKEDSKEYDFDLRKPNDLERSHLLHRLLLLNIPWGTLSHGQGKKAGTFHEYWELQWKPEFVINLIQASRWGNTVEKAASSKCINAAGNLQNIKEIAMLLDSALLADLPEAANALILSIQERTAVSGDVEQMMEALGPLARVMRYGNVRQTDKDMLVDVVNGLASRVMINLPVACCNINEEAAEHLFELINSTHSAITLLQDSELVKGWDSVLKQLTELKNGHNLINGRCCRLLYDRESVSSEETATKINLSLSSANESDQAAAWLDGFLRGSGLVLIHDRSLWSLIDQWVCELKPDHFMEILPLLRRTFSTFEMPERRQIGQQAKSTSSASSGQISISHEFDIERAKKVLPLLSKILQEEIEL